MRKRTVTVAAEVVAAEVEVEVEVATMIAGVAAAVSCLFPFHVLPLLTSVKYQSDIHDKQFLCPCSNLFTHIFICHQMAAATEEVAADMAVVAAVVMTIVGVVADVRPYYDFILLPLLF